MIFRDLTRPGRRPKLDNYFLTYLIRACAWQRDGSSSQTSIYWPTVTTSHTITDKIVLTLQLPLPLLPGHDGVVVAVVVQDLLPRQDCSDARHHRAEIGNN